MEDLVLIHHHDPSHGWVEVKRELVEMLGIQGLITSFSYQKGDRLFLEEDADASLLIRSLGELNIYYTVVDRRTNTDHWIRALDRYNALD